MKTPELIEAIDFLFTLSDAIRDSIRDDGKISISDTPRFFKVATSAPKGIGGINRIPAEVAGMDDAAFQEVVEHVKTRFDIEDEKLEAYLENTIQAAGLLALNVLNIYNLKKKAKA